MEPVVICRNLDRRYSLHCADAQIRETIRFLECTPDIAPPPLDIGIVIKPYRSYFRIAEEGTVLTEVLGADGVLNYLHVYLFSKSIEDRPNAAVVHAACLRRNGRRILLLGTKSAGKTTLTLRLLASGYDIEGDEQVFLEAQGVVARPRACRVKVGTLDFVPQFADVIRAAPSYTDEQVGTIYNVDPRRLGSACWRIEPGDVDHLVVLQPNHGGYSSLRPLAAPDLLRHMLPELGLRDTGRGHAMAALARLASRAQLHDMSLGDPAGAVRCLDRLMTQ